MIRRLQYGTPRRTTPARARTIRRPASVAPRAEMELAGVVQAGVARAASVARHSTAVGANREPGTRFWRQWTVTTPLPPLNIASATCTSVRGLKSSAHWKSLAGPAGALIVELVE